MVDLIPISISFWVQEFIKTTFQDIVADEFKKIKDSSLDEISGMTVDDALWEYDGLHTAYQGECEEILLEMQRIFYEDLRTEPATRGKLENQSCFFQKICCYYFQLMGCRWTSLAHSSPYSLHYCKWTMGMLQLKMTLGNYLWHVQFQASLRI